MSDAKQCGHQAGKVTVPHEDFLAKINAVRYAFLELGVEDGVIVARTDSLGAGLTQKIPVSKTPGDLADKYNGFLETVPVNSLEELKEGETLIHKEGKLFKTVRMPNGLYRFRDDSNSERVILDCITSLQSGADLLWIETAVPNLKQISSLVNAIRTQVNKKQLFLLLFDLTSNICLVIFSVFTIIVCGRLIASMMMHKCTQIRKKFPLCH